jgi:Arsenical resistance operon protein ArsD
VSAVVDFQNRFVKANYMEIQAGSERNESITGKVVRVEIFDPPMCCPTGLCGPAMDPALLDVYEAILKIKAEYDGQAVLERYVLGQQPAKFMQQPEVIRRLKAHGVAILPVTTVNGVVLKERVYPSYTELKQWIESGGEL